MGLLSLRVVPQQQCNGHCPCDSAQAQQLKRQLRGALVTAQWRGDTALTLPLFWRQSTVSVVEPSLFRPFSPPPPPPSPPVPNKPLRFCGRKAKWLVGRSVGYALSVPNKPPRFCGRKAKWLVGRSVGYVLSVSNKPPHFCGRKATCLLCAT